MNSVSEANNLCCLWVGERFFRRRIKMFKAERIFSNVLNIYFYFLVSLMKYLRNLWIWNIWIWREISWQQFLPGTKKNFSSVSHLDSLCRYSRRRKYRYDKDDFIFLPVVQTTETHKQKFSILTTSRCLLLNLQIEKS